jgi:hypothetical protein
LRDLAAEKSAGDRMVRIAPQLRALAVLVNVDEERAAIGAIERAHGVPDFRHDLSIIAGA